MLAVALLIASSSCAPWDVGCSDNVPGPVSVAAATIAGAATMPVLLLGAVYVAASVGVPVPLGARDGPYIIGGAIGVGMPLGAAAAAGFASTRAGGDPVRIALVSGGIVLVAVGGTAAIVVFAPSEDNTLAFAAGGAGLVLAAVAAGVAEAMSEHNGA